MGKKPSGPVPRQAANSGNHENQSNAPPSSLSSQKAKTVSENPVGGTVNDDSDNDTVGGIFRLKSKKDSQSTGTMHERDCSLEVISMPLRDWSRTEVLESIRDCFVTGKWKDSEDAEILLQNDDQSMNLSYNNVSRFYICVLRT